MVCGSGVLLLNLKKVNQIVNAQTCRTEGLGLSIYTDRKNSEIVVCVRISVRVCVLRICAFSPRSRRLIRYGHQGREPGQGC